MADVPDGVERAMAEQASVGAQLRAVRRARAGDPPPCPECGSTDVVPITYGTPGPELAAAAARGEVELGGSVVTGDDPTHRCRSCGHGFTIES